MSANHFSDELSAHECKTYLETGGWHRVRGRSDASMVLQISSMHAEIARLTAENEALLDRFAKQLIPLTPGQCVDIADVAAKLEFSDNFLSDICKIVEMVEVAHGIGEKP